MACNPDSGTSVEILRDTTLTPFSAAYTRLADGTWYFHVRAIDAAGAAGPTATYAVHIDTAPPVTTISGTDDLWHNEPVPLGLSATDAPGGSGMSGGQATTEYKIGSSAWTAGTSLTVPAPPDHSGDGVQTVSYRSCDAAGNWEAAKTATVKIDTTPPAGSFTLDDGALTTASPLVTVDSTVSDANGVAQMRFSTDGEADWSAWASYGAAVQLFLPAGNGTKTVWAQYRDPAGNVCEGSAAITLDESFPDATPPTVSASGVTDGAWVDHAVTIALTAVDNPGGSGVAAITYSLDGVADTIAAAEAQVAIAASPNATHTITYSASDLAGNSSAEHSLTLHIDTLGPTTVVRPASGRKGGVIKLRFEVRDNMSPEATAVKLTVRDSHNRLVRSFALGIERTSDWYVVRWRPRRTGRFTYSIAAKDLAGNAQAKAVSARIRVVGRRAVVHGIGIQSRSSR